MGFFPFRRQNTKIAPITPTAGVPPNVNGNGTATTKGDTPAVAMYSPTKAQIKRATRTRKIWCITTAVLLFIAVIFIIMVEIGSTFNKPVLRNIWFINLNLSNVIPASVPDSGLLNSIAQTLGLHDFYQVGLWGYCEGYENEGVTDCSHPVTMYWFDPVAIILNQLISGASITLPTEITEILNILRIVSRWMFVLFLTGACLSTVMIGIVLASVYSRWTAFVIMLFTLLNAIFITVASIIGTAMFVIMRNVFATNDTVNIGATVGTTMFALMWVASACSLVAFVIQLALSCCCASRRDVRRGKKQGSKKAYMNDPPIYTKESVAS